MAPDQIIQIAVAVALVVGVVIVGWRVVAALQRRPKDANSPQAPSSAPPEPIVDPGPPQPAAPEPEPETEPETAPEPEPEPEPVLATMAELNDITAQIRDGGASAEQAEAFAQHLAASQSPPAKPANGAPAAGLAERADASTRQAFAQAVVDIARSDDAEAREALVGDNPLARLESRALGLEGRGDRAGAAQAWRQVAAIATLSDSARARDHRAEAERLEADAAASQAEPSPAVAPLPVTADLEAPSPSNADDTPPPNPDIEARLTQSDAAFAARDAGAALSHAIAAERLAAATDTRRDVARAQARQGRALCLTTQTAKGCALMSEAHSALSAHGHQVEAHAIAQWLRDAGCAEPPA